ncbi:MAG: hypothetical protein ABIO55_07955 [Ginsengibacter sp.]
MNPEEEFTKKVLGGIYLPNKSDFNFEVYDWLQKNVESLFTSGLLDFKNKEPHFYFIQSYDINGSCDDDEEYCYIGLTKGLINFSTFFMNNILKEQSFLSDMIVQEKEHEQPKIIKSVQFKSWNTFSDENFLSEQDSNKPKNAVRAELADSLNKYFLLFYFMHEVGHLNQDRKKLSEMKEQCSNDIEKNIIQQVKEMDSDLYAVNRFLEHLFNTFHNKHNLIDNAYSSLYKTETDLLRYALLIIHFTFYMFPQNDEKGLSKNTHPNPILRLFYVSTLMLNNSIENNLLNRDNWETCRRRSIQDFKYIIKKVFPNEDIKKSFGSITPDELTSTYRLIRNEASKPKYKGLLNGTYEEISDQF